MRRRSLISLLLAFAAVSCTDGRPVIGISSGCTDRRVSVRDEYSRAVTRAGGIPLIIPETTDRALVEEYMGIIDGLLMSGGDDVNPARYGEKILNETVICDEIRDTSDFLLLDAAARHHIPVLAICRGAQVADVMYGGRLYQDIPSQVKGNVEHHQGERARHLPQHYVRIVEGSRLQRIMAADSIAVNSFHHQAVKDLGTGFTVSAMSSDGVIEGFEGNGIMAVQFHPESSVSAGDDTLLPIFTDFIKEASERAPGKRL